MAHICVLHKSCHGTEAAIVTGDLNATFLRSMSRVVVRLFLWLHLFPLAAHHPIRLSSRRLRIRNRMPHAVC